MSEVAQMAPETGNSAARASFDSRIQEYLSKLKPSTKAVSEAALIQFREFYGSQGSIIDFYRRVYEDSKLHPLDQKRVDTNTIAAFVAWLIPKYQNKTVRTYVGVLQSLGQYLRIPFSARFTGMPPALVATKKHSWELDEVAKFVESFNSPLYQSLATAYFQSGCDISTLGCLHYSDIQAEFEAGIVPILLDMARYKTKVPYLTFLGEWATKYLRVWLESRGSVKPDDRLWPVTKQAIDAYFHSRALRYANIASFEFRNPYAPHTLRAGCNTHLRNHKADPIYTAFWMGHDVPEQEKVYVSKTHEGWRKTYVLMAEAWVTPPEFRRKELKDIAKAWAKTNGLVE